jgi:hypothetical protein
MTRIVTRDGLTIEINPIPSGKLVMGKRPEGGILTCDRCGRQEANVERNENGWELWYRRKPPHPEPAVSRRGRELLRGLVAEAPLKARR